MSNKHILVTGCSSGIGLACARMLRARGHRVYVTARREADLQRLREAGYTALHLELASSESIAACTDALLARSGGRLDALVNNAAYGQPGAVEDLSRAALREQFEANLFGTQELTNRLIPVMRRAGSGRIVYISSVLGLAALPYRGAYVASKFALEGLADTLRLELRGSGIAVALVEPGPIESRFRDNAYAAFQRHIDPEHSAHAETYRAVERRLRAEGGGAFTLPASAVAGKVCHAVEHPRPKARYYVTFPTRLFGTLRRLLSTRALDWVLLKATEGERR
ncbi:SDR family NAD(P)-dependent oxidoreductase [Alkalilimnicola sp. S0819]|uniref:SDR family NAD(P)-dependent oxidoreductase n=1 Tax=Alkalilimnicola sp. S0819 TaxID=2613922 RepID=UPI001D01DD9B|nr:SDR family NAD(P)-dependent oxidoreductase [Alkalilimnicola sp. S0819]